MFKRETDLGDVLPFDDITVSVLQDLLRRVLFRGRGGRLLTEVDLRRDSTSGERSAGSVRRVRGGGKTLRVSLGR